MAKKIFRTQQIDDTVGGIKVGQVIKSITFSIHIGYDETITGANGKSYPAVSKNDQIADSMNIDSAEAMDKVMEKYPLLSEPVEELIKKIAQPFTN